MLVLVYKGRYIGPGNEPYPSYPVGAAEMFLGGFQQLTPAATADNHLLTPPLRSIRAGTKKKKNVPHPEAVDRKQRSRRSRRREKEPFFLSCANLTIDLHLFCNVVLFAFITRRSCDT